MRRWPRLLGFFLLSGALAGLVGGFFAGVLVALIEVGPVALLPVGPFAGFLSALFGFRLMTLPAAVWADCSGRAAYATEPSGRAQARSRVSSASP